MAQDHEHWGCLEGGYAPGSSAADVSGPATVPLRRRAMVATKPSNPSIVNIASVCGIRGSGKECVSYQVPLLSATALLLSVARQDALSVDLSVLDLSVLAVCFLCRLLPTAIQMGCSDNCRICAGGKGGRRRADALGRSEAGVPWDPCQRGVAVDHGHGAPLCRNFGDVRAWCTDRPADEAAAMGSTDSEVRRAAPDQPKLGPGPCP